MSRATQIGWYNLKEDKTVRCYAECPKYDHDVLVKAGSYPVEVYDIRFDKDGAIRGFGFVHMGEAHPSLYMHEIAQSIVDGGDHYELFPEYEARRVDFEYNGEPCTTYCVFKRGA